jgi:hypothetical protein
VGAKSATSRCAPAPNGSLATSVASECDSGAQILRADEVAGMLYVAGNRFVCRRCGSLVYAVQRESRLVGLLHRADRDWSPQYEPSEAGVTPTG